MANFRPCNCSFIFIVTHFQINYVKLLKGLKRIDGSKSFFSLRSYGIAPGPVVFSRGAQKDLHLDNK